jgi:hypothetical protein
MFKKIFIPEVFFIVDYYDGYIHTGSYDRKAIYLYDTTRNQSAYDR